MTRCRRCSPLAGRRRVRRGMALLDAMIGALMLGVGLSVILSMSTRSLRTQADAERRITATWLADEMLNMVLVEGPEPYAQMYNLSGRFDPPFEDFTYELDLRDLGAREPYEVNVVVEWPGARSPVAVRTLIARHLGDPDQPREPLEVLDRAGRWYEKKYGEPAAGAGAGEGEEPPPMPGAGGGDPGGLIGGGR